MSSQSGSFDAALVNVAPNYTFSTAGGTSFSSSVAVNALTTLSPGTVSGGTTLTFTSAGLFAASNFAVNNVVVFTPDWGTGNTTNSITFANGDSTTPIGVISLPISAWNNSSSVAVTLPATYPNGALIGGVQSYLSVFSPGTTPSITFTGTGFPILPVGTLVTITNATGTTVFGNYNRIINRPVLTSTSTQLTISGWVYHNASFSSATVSSPGSYFASTTYAGTGYTTGDTFIIRGTMLNGTSPANDLTLTVTAGTVNGLPNAVSSLTQSGTASGNLISTPVTLEYPNNKTARDASDITQKLKERLAYNEYRSGTNIAGALKADRRGNILLNNAGAANQAELLQSNAFRLSYLKGRMNCGACMGGYFNANGPLSFNSSGQRTGS